MKQSSRRIRLLSMFLMGCLSACSSDGDTPVDSDGGRVVDSGREIPDAMPIACDPGTVRCGGECVDPLLDHRFCGATSCEDDATDGEECAAGSVCDGAGSCQAFACETISGGGKGVCNPVTQAGCAEGEKCAEQIVSASPFLAQTACIPDGNIPTNGACTICGDGMVGYDNCQAGNDCFGGKCLSLCGSAPDTCRSAPDPGFGNGSYCGNNFANHFADDIGVCIPACNPVNDSTVSGIAVNGTCGAGSACNLNPIIPQATCAGVPDGSLGKTQNHIPFGPAPGAVFVNGCASGFTTLLNEKVGSDPGNAQCTRFCNPIDTYKGLGGNGVGTPAGSADKCGVASLDALGGRNGHNVAHQCRFIQGLYSNVDVVPASVGMCMPITPSGGGLFELGNGASAPATFADCTLFEWEGLKNVWNAAAPQGSDAVNTAFDNFCFSNPGNPATSTVLDRCIGFFFGCVSNATLDELNQPSGAASIDLTAFRERLLPMIDASHQTAGSQSVSLTPN